MATRIEIPQEALGDFLVLLRMPSSQRDLVEDAFDSEEAAYAFGAAFRDQLAEFADLDQEQATSIAVVLGFALSLTEREGMTAEALLDATKALVAASDEADKDALLAELEAGRAQWLRLFTEKPRRARGRKIVRLSRSTHDALEGCRTTCQLRPLFEEVAAEDEQIVGMVPSVVLEMDIVNCNGEEETKAFSVGVDDLATIAEVMRRTEEKVRKMKERYGAQILDIPGRSSDD